MKKTLSIILCLALVILSFTACSSSNALTEENVTKTVDTSFEALKEFDTDKMTGAIRQKADALMRSEVAAYDSYLRGECYGFELYKNGELSDSCWGFMGNFSDVLKDMAEYLPDECKGMVDHLEEQERPATIIKTLLKHAKIQVDQAAKAFEHASRQQVLGESR